MATFGERMLGAAQLDAAVYEEVENDAGATSQAVIVVVLSSVAAGLGSRGGVGGLVAGTVGGIVGWAIWSWLTWLIGTRWLPEPSTSADTGQLLRAVGFAHAPGVLRVLGLVPILGGLVTAAASIWMLVAVVIAVRQALDYTSTWRAIGVCVIGWVIEIVVIVVLVGLFVRM